MKKFLTVLGLTILALAIWVAAFLFANHSVNAKSGDVVQRPRDGLPQAGQTLEVLNWNLGYGGLGAGSDFIADGGTHFLPPSRRDVVQNVAGIEAFLALQTGADVVLIQEIARGSALNYWIDLKARVDNVFRERSSLYFSDFKTRLAPWPLHIQNGQVIYSRRAVESADLVALLAEDNGIAGVRRRYASTVARIPIEGAEAGWTVAVVHLAAFDEDAAVRTRQLHELLAWAEGEYQRGQHVVLGGDWNFQIAETDFPHTTTEEFLFWLFPFPQDALPEGWRIAADANIPSVRTNERPFVPGENYTTVIDGFIVSPNVAVGEVGGFDLGFAHSDHQPVLARFRAQ